MPVWGWILSALGTIAAGIGLGYLIIFFFWKIEKLMAPMKVAVIETPQESDNAVTDDKPVPDDTGKTGETEPENETIIEPETEAAAACEVTVVPETKEVHEEELTPVMVEKNDLRERRSIKFVTVLKPAFKHPFRTADTIVCWDMAVTSGDCVRDCEGNELWFQVMKTPEGKQPEQYWLTDADLCPVISVVSAKQYIKAETNLDLDTVSTGIRSRG